MSTPGKIGYLLVYRRPSYCICFSLLHAIGFRGLWLLVMTHKFPHNTYWQGTLVFCFAKIFFLRLTLSVEYSFACKNRSYAQLGAEFSWLPARVHVVYQHALWDFPGVTQT